MSQISAFLGTEGGGHKVRLVMSVQYGLFNIDNKKCPFNVPYLQGTTVEKVSGYITSRKILKVQDRLPEDA